MRHARRQAPPHRCWNTNRDALGRVPFSNRLRRHAYFWNTNVIGKSKVKDELLFSLPITATIERWQRAQPPAATCIYDRPM